MSQLLPVSAAMRTDSVVKSVAALLISLVAGIVLLAGLRGYRD